MLAGLEVSVSRSFWLSHGHICTFSKLVTQSLCPCTCSTANLSAHRVLILQVVSSNHVSYAYVYYIKECVLLLQISQEKGVCCWLQIPHWPSSWNHLWRTCVTAYLHSATAQKPWSGFALQIFKKKISLLPQMCLNMRFQGICKGKEKNQNRGAFHVQINSYKNLFLGNVLNWLTSSRHHYLEKLNYCSE